MHDLDRAIVHVVDPKGVIRSVQLARHIQSPLVEARKLGKMPFAGFHRLMARGVVIKSPYDEQGFTLLIDHYKAEGDLEGYANYVAWEDCKRPTIKTEYSVPKQRISYRDGSGQEKEIEIDKPYPEEDLPLAVLRKRRDLGTANVWKSPREGNQQTFEEREEMAALEAAEQGAE